MKGKRSLHDQNCHYLSVIRLLEWFAKELTTPWDATLASVSSTSKDVLELGGSNSRNRSDISIRNLVKTNNNNNSEGGGSLSNSNKKDLSRIKAAATNNVTGKDNRSLVIGYIGNFIKSFIMKYKLL